MWKIVLLNNETITFRKLDSLPSSGKKEKKRQIYFSRSEASSTRGPQHIGFLPVPYEDLLSNRSSFTIQTTNKSKIKFLHIITLSLQTFRLRPKVKEINEIFLCVRLRIFRKMRGL